MQLNITIQARLAVSNLTILISCCGGMVEVNSEPFRLAWFGKRLYKKIIKSTFCTVHNCIVNASLALNWNKNIQHSPSPFWGTITHHKHFNKMFLYFTKKQGKTPIFSNFNLYKNATYNSFEKTRIEPTATWLVFCKEPIKPHHFRSSKQTRVDI